MYRKRTEHNRFFPIEISAKRRLSESLAENGFLMLY